MKEQIKSITSTWSTIYNEIRCLLEMSIYTPEVSQQIMEHLLQCDEFFKAYSNNNASAKSIDFLFTDTWNNFQNLLRKDNFGPILDQYFQYFEALLHVVNMDHNIEQEDKDNWSQFVCALKYCTMNLAAGAQHETYSFLTQMLYSIGLVRPCILCLSLDQSPHRAVFKSSNVKLRELKSHLDSIERLDTIIKVTVSIESKFKFYYPQILEYTITQFEYRLYKTSLKTDLLNKTNIEIKKISQQQEPK